VKAKHVEPKVAEKTSII